MATIPTRYSLRIYNKYGSLLDELLTGRDGDALKLDYARTQGSVGAMVVDLPNKYPKEWFEQDNYFEVGRSIDGGPFDIHLDTRWLINAREKPYRSGSYRWVITALDATSLVKWRTVAHYKGEAYSKKSGRGDDLMKAFMRENCTATAIAYSNLSGFSLIPPQRQINNLTIEADTSQGALMDYEGQHKRLSDVFADIAKTSQGKGTWLGWDVAWDGNSNIFRTYTGQRGTDRRADLTLRPGYGLGDGSLKIDWSESYTVVFAGGDGANNARNVVVAIDQQRLADSPHAWREVFQDAKDKSGLTYIQDDALPRLREGRPKYSLAAQVIQQENLVFGRDYDYGDQLGVEFDGESFDARFSGARVVVEGGKDQITIGLSESGTLGGSDTPIWGHMLAGNSQSGLFRVLQQLNYVDYQLRRMAAVG